MSNWSPDITADSIPDEVITAEYKRRIEPAIMAARSAARQTKAGGRPVVMKRCPRCHCRVTARQMRAACPHGYSELGPREAHKADCAYRDGGDECDCSRHPRLRGEA